jgi:hypothetical protein
MEHNIAGTGSSRSVGATWLKPPSHDSSLVLPQKEKNEKGNGGKVTDTHLENLFRMRPAGVTSKKDMGDLKIAVAILSCNFRDAYANHL